jgi:hypothetical protein
MSSNFPLPSANFSSAVTAPPAPIGRGEKAAHEFEAQLLTSLLGPMEKTFAALPGDDTTPGSDDYNYLGTHALAEGLAEAGGFGIATLIARYLSVHESSK